MTKVFFKSMFVTFLWLIAFINLIFAFNLADQLPIVGVSGKDTTDTYFGMSTLINFVSNLDESSFPALAGFKGFITNIQITIRDALSMNWDEVFNAQINNPADFFVAFGNFFVNLFKMLGSMVIYIALLPLWIGYYLALFIQISLVIFKLMAGYYATPIPHSGLLDSIMLPMQTLV